MKSYELEIADLVIVDGFNGFNGRDLVLAIVTDLESRDLQIVNIGLRVTTPGDRFVQANAVAENLIAKVEMDSNKARILQLFREGWKPDPKNSAGLVFDFTDQQPSSAMMELVSLLEDAEFNLKKMRSIIRSSGWK